MATIGRNVPCPCGSGRKYKHCHGRHTVEPAAAIEVRQVMQEYAAAERIRQMQQGRGRPIVSVKLKDHQMVAVGNTVHFSKTWKAFPDFLSAYIKTKLGPEWGNAEIAKPLAVRHPLMQWYDAYCRYQKETIKRPGEMHSAEITGVVACYLGLAYALYLLAHNVELQDRLIKRLRNVGNFQGAYYELMVASILIRAGFKLTLEDETDPGAKHCEFAAVAEKTGKKYWVEAKMRSVNGLLGRTTADGGADGDALGRLIPHLNNALAKPAKDERLIFIDVNAPPVFDKQGKPNWLEPALVRLEKYEQKELKQGMDSLRLSDEHGFSSPARPEAFNGRSALRSWSAGFQPAWAHSRDRGVQANAEAHRRAPYRPVTGELPALSRYVRRSTAIGSIRA